MSSFPKAFVEIAGTVGGSVAAISNEVNRTAGVEDPGSTVYLIQIGNVVLSAAASALVAALVKEGFTFLKNKFSKQDNR